MFENVGFSLIPYPPPTRRDTRTPPLISGTWRLYSCAHAQMSLIVYWAYVWWIEPLSVQGVRWTDWEWSRMEWGVGVGWNGMSWSRKTMGQVRWCGMNRIGWQMRWCGVRGQTGWQVRWTTTTACYFSGWNDLLECQFPVLVLNKLHQDLKHCSVNISFSFLLFHCTIIYTLVAYYIPWLTVNTLLDLSSMCSDIGNWAWATPLDSALW